MTDFQSFNLNEKILHSLASKGYSTPTPIQAEAIPHILEGRDFLGIAQTGTGKTAAFALPTIHLLSQKHKKVSPNCVRALVLTPTRELASQVAQSFITYGHNLHLKCTTIYGGVGEASQIKAMSNGVDILIATPGRLIDLTEQGHVDYSQIEIFILDEADRMLDMGFIDDIKKIIAKLPSNKQTLFFSATMPPVIEGLANSILNNPTKVEITPQSTTVEKIAQSVHVVSKANKATVLNSLLKSDEIKTALIFCQMKHSANRLSQFLEQQGIDNAVLHGNKSQNAREKALKSFRDGKCKILIATDIAARGIDIPDISHVINYDLPRDIENYVHRIGRTARAGRDGVAISLCDATELKSLRLIEKAIGMKIPLEKSIDFSANEEINSSRIAGVRLSKGNDGINSNQPNSESNMQSSGRSGRRIFSSSQNSGATANISNHRNESLSDGRRFSEKSDDYHPRERSSSGRSRNTSGTSMRSSENERPARDESSNRPRRANTERRHNSERRVGSSSRESSGLDMTIKKEERKTGILQKIFGGWGKKDSRADLEESVTKRFTSKSFANSGSTDGYLGRNSRRSSSSRSPSNSSGRSFFSKKGDAYSGKPRRGGGK